VLLEVIKWPKENQKRIVVDVGFVLIKDVVVVKQLRKWVKGERHLHMVEEEIGDMKWEENNWLVR
jgi:hypothetical protein